ncbi:MAG: GAP family protein [Actinobacteria bacterium]|nr:GAP family protein [Actinomycetota bacterium]
MGEAIGQVLPLAVGVALSPVPIIGVTLMLATPRARSNGLAFIGGWIAGLAIAGAAFLLLSSGAGASEGSEPADWVGVVKLALGALLLLVAARQWRGRPRAGAEAPMPKWMQSIDGFRAPKAAGLAVLLAAVNPKNLLLVIAAAAAISQTGVAAGQQALALGVFVLIGTVGPGAPLAIYFLLGDRSREVLDELRSWMTQNNATIMAVLCLVIGAKLIGDGIGGLS